ncbi:MAG: tetratricopeptide repeat protein [Candidatus Zhuqueibacterota bacterium]
MTVISKKSIFSGIMVLLPFLFLFLFEISLRVFRYGDDLNLVLVREANGEKFYQLNENVAKRYFIRTPAHLIPQLYPQKFEYNKSPRTVRIFLLGGSTMAGFPFELNARINSLLRDRLFHFYPGKEFEVINVGLSAINSYTVMEFVDELVKYEPDLFIFYLGHNEFYGAFGAGSVERLGKIPAITRTYLNLRKLRTFHLLRNIYAAISASTRSAPDQPSNRTLMASMADKKSIAFGSSDYRLAHANFEKNMSRIFATCQSNDVPVLMSTITSNLRGQPPFISLFSDSLSEASKARWNTFFRYGGTYKKEGRWVLALSSFEDAKAIDAMPAQLHFEMGECVLGLGDSATVREYFVRARDLDGLRFRASSDINAIIRKLCTQRKIPLVDTDAAFAGQSPRGIIGNELISEHLHPNFNGYFLMAKTLAQAIDEFNFFGTQAQNLHLTDDFFADYSRVTLIDRAIGDKKIEQLTSGWPYSKKVTATIPADPQTATMVELLVSQYSSQQISWNEAHNRLAGYYGDRGMFPQAVNEYQAVIKVVPENYFPYFKIGNLFFIQNQHDLAEQWFNLAFKLNSGGAFIPAKLGMVYLMKKDYASAVSNFQQALSLDKKQNQLSNDEKILAHYYLAVSYVSTKQPALAKAELEQVLRLDPSHANARQLSGLLAQNKEIKIQF